MKNQILISERGDFQILISERGFHFMTEDVRSAAKTSK